MDELFTALLEHRAWLESSGERERRRGRGRVAWALELFSERYGELGIERLRGRAAAEALAAELSGTALDAFSELSSRAGLEALPD